MPKKFPPAEKRKWLELYEAGKSEASIANKAKCNVRTVKKGIEDARLERDASLARAELIKEALRNHQDALLNLLGELSTTSKTFNLQQSVPWEPHNRNITFRTQIATIDCVMGSPKVTGLVLDLEGRPEWELLREHLGKDRFWRHILQWKRLLGVCIEKVIALERELASLLSQAGKEEKGIFELRDKGKESNFIYRDFVTLGAQRLIEPKHRLASAKELEDNIFEEEEKGVVRLGRVAIAHAPGATAICHRQIAWALRELRKSTEAGEAIASYRELEATTNELGEAVEEFLMLNLVPGRCRVCKRFGM